jgi:hypothetical protein
MLNNSLENGENGLHKRVTLADFCSFYLLTRLIFFLGVGSTKPNEREDGEDEEPEELENEAWMKLLDDDDDGTLSLKPWKEVTTARANKANVALALREVMRQAWGGCIFLSLYSLFNLSYIEQSDRRGKIAWGKIKTDSESLIDPRFLLEAKLGNPTRMPLQSITAYWKHWVSQEKKGDPFSFISPDGEGDKGESDANSDKGKGDGGIADDGQDGPEEPDHYSIDHDIPYPFLCDTPSMRTNCLHQLVSNNGAANKGFHALVNMVNTFEVSPISSI